MGSGDSAWTAAAIDAILTLHSCPARCGARRRVKPPSFRSAPCLVPKQVGLLSRHQPLRQAATARSDPTKSTKCRRVLSLSRRAVRSENRRIDADSDSRRQQSLSSVERAIVSMSTYHPVDTSRCRDIAVSMFRSVGERAESVQAPAGPLHSARTGALRIVCTTFAMSHAGRIRPEPTPAMLHKYSPPYETQR